MGIVNRRNAVLGWSVWRLGKRLTQRKAKRAAPSLGSGRANKSLLAVAIAGMAGVLTFWHRRKTPKAEG